MWSSRTVCTRPIKIKTITKRKGLLVWQNKTVSPPRCSFYGINGLSLAFFCSKTVMSKKGMNEIQNKTKKTTRTTGTPRRIWKPPPPP